MLNPIQSKFDAIPIRPFEIIQQAPYEISSHITPFPEHNKHHNQHIYYNPQLHLQILHLPYSSSKICKIRLMKLDSPHILLEPIAFLNRRRVTCRSYSFQITFYTFQKQSPFNLSNTHIYTIFSHKHWHVVVSLLHVLDYILHAPRNHKESNHSSLQDGWIGSLQNFTKNGSMW